jgi:hypothetical protein
MSKEVEETFVNTFVLKERRERAAFELSSDSKRWKFLDRLCHEFSGVLDTRYFRPVDEIGYDPVALARRLKSLGAGDTCHVISWNDKVDGKDIPLEEAARAVMSSGFASILICVPDALAYFEAEQVKGPPPRYLLVK